MNSFPEKLILSFLKKHQLLDSRDDRAKDYFRDATWLRGKAFYILFPESHEEVARILKIFHEGKREGTLPGSCHISVRGGGTGLSGAAVPDGGIVLSLERLNTVCEINRDELWIRAGAGCLTSEITQRAEEAGLYYPVDPSSRTAATIGGNIATNAAGAHSLLYGSTRSHVRRLRVVWPDGESDWLGARPPKSSVGFSLKELMIGSQGQFAVTTEVMLSLNNPPQERFTLFIVLDEFEETARAIFDLLHSHHPVSAIEFLDVRSLSASQWPVEVKGSEVALLVDLDGSRELLEAALRDLSGLFPEEKTFFAADAKAQRILWQAREAVSGNLSRSFPFKVGEDFSIPLSNLSPFLEFVYTLSRQENLDVAIWGHAGEGNLHVNFLFQEEKELEKVQKMIATIAEKSVALEGSLSGEHGLGRIKRDLIQLEQSERLIHYQRELKKIFDPYHLLNPLLLP